MDILFLGTGAGVPGKVRNVSSLALRMLNERGAVWLFDCGEATQHQILHTSLKPRRIEKIFITHLHGDHIFGLPGLLGSRSFQGGELPLTVYGPKGIKEFIQVSISISGTRLQYELEIIEIDEGHVFEDDHLTVTARRLEHGIESYGYRLQEKDKPGVLLVEELKKDGIPPGPLYKEIKLGNTVTLEDGRLIDPKKYTGLPQKGKTIAILGDSRPCEAAVELAREADLLIHEATFSAETPQMAHDYFHSTTAQAAEIASKAGVKTLILNHISSRYTKDEMEQLKREAEAVFTPVLLAYDFMEFSI
ncbi:ribonuclease Z [Pseudobacillus wudalianchiensis]|uniref:Ribonuclease Z n=1 Tax=Pseudobacillus wudalianchiensis TaxID=1743143 RepID=A0A1B9B9D2_9BACI|nr:ribonuclease Z [Bacillus wudalianchiensis]OCA92681.1 ribonuclease Z [Bacillus wudalianchiensis]